MREMITSALLFFVVFVERLALGARNTFRTLLNFANFVSENVDGWLLAAVASALVACICINEATSPIDGPRIYFWIFIAALTIAIFCLLVVVCSPDRNVNVLETD
jgi:hypothetical protein